MPSRDPVAPEPDSSRVTGVDHGAPEGPFTEEQAAEIEEREKRREKSAARLRFVDGEPPEAQLYKRAAAISDSFPEPGGHHVRPRLLRPRATGAVRAQLTRGLRPRARRGRPVRHRGSRRVASSRAGPDDPDSDEGDPGAPKLWESQWGRVSPNLLRVLLEHGGRST
jgi:hypothetical protein